MPTSPTPDDLLALKKFCWGELPDGHAPAVSVSALELRDGHWLRAAEAILIERGLADRYGAALIAELGRSPHMPLVGTPSSGRTAVVIATENCTSLGRPSGAFLTARGASALDRCTPAAGARPGGRSAP